MGNGAIYTIIGIQLTFAIFLAHIIFKSGHLAARVEELERWRLDVRKDMHEVSDALEKLNVSVKHLATLIEERTERRREPRAAGGSGHQH